MATRVKVRPPERGADLRAVRCPGERLALVLALLSWGVGLGALLTVLWFIPALRQVSIAGMVLVGVSLLVFGRVFPWMEQRQLRGFGRRVIPSPGTELALALDRFARVARLPKRPTLVLVPGTPTADLLGHQIVITEPLRDQLTPVELRAVLARQVGHIAAGHRPWFALRRRVLRAHPLVRGTVGLPLVPLALALSSWEHTAHLTSDRYALLLVPDPRAVAAALLKLAILHDPASEIVIEEVDWFLAARAQGQEEEQRVTAHFKIDRYLERHHDLNVRLQDLAYFATSDLYRELSRRVRTQSSAARSGTRPEADDAAQE